MFLWTTCVYFIIVCEFLAFAASARDSFHGTKADYCLKSPGTDSSRVVTSEGKCICKRNVRGNDCSRCKKNAFYLSDSHPEGCLKCFCSGRSKKCSSSQLRREQVEYTFSEHNQGFELVSRNLSLVNGSPKIDDSNKEIFITQLPVDSSETYYWKLPNAFLGDKLTSYGGNLTFDLSYEVPSTERSRWNKGPLAIIKGDGIEMQYRELIKEKRHSKQHLALSEELWSRTRMKKKKRRQARLIPAQGKKKKNKQKKKKKKPIKRKHLLRILSNVEHILVKANYRRHSDEVRLRSVSITEASENGPSETIAEEVERCECPPEYSGLSCQHCASGYTKLVSPDKRKDGTSTFTCVPCQCNGKSNLCHPDTGECFNCQDGTSGRHCDTSDAQLECDERGKAYRGDSDCICKPRVEGESCNECRQGFFHLSFDNEQGCKTCWCNGVTSACQSSRLYRSEINLLSETSSYVSLALVLGDGRTILSPVTLKNTTAEFYQGPFEMKYWSLPKRFTGNLLRSYGGELKFTIYNSGSCSALEENRLMVELIDYQRRSFQWKFKEQIDLNEPSTFFVSLLEEQFLYMNSPIQRNYFMRLLSFVREIKISIPRCARLRYTSIKDIVLTTAVPYDTGHPQAVEVEHCLCPPQYSGLSCETCAPRYIRDPYTKRCIRKSYLRPQ